MQTVVAITTGSTSDGSIASRDPATNEILVNTTIGGIQSMPDVASAPDGRAVVVWSGAGNGDSDGVFMQRFPPMDDVPLPNGSTSQEVRVNQFARGQQAYAAVAMADDGSFVVTWSSRHQDGSGWGVYYRIFNADGTPRTDERLASSSSINSQFRSRVGMDAQGNFAIAWSGFNAASSWDVYFRRFDRLGQPRGPEQQVNTRSAGHQRDPDLAMAADGRFIISWTSGNPNASGSSAAAAGMCMLAYTTQWFSTLG